MFLSPKQFHSKAIDPAIVACYRRNSVHLGKGVCRTTREAAGRFPRTAGRCSPNNEVIAKIVGWEQLDKKVKYRHEKKCNFARAKYGEDRRSRRTCERPSSPPLRAIGRDDALKPFLEDARSKMSKIVRTTCVSVTSEEEETMGERGRSAIHPNH